jgi:hypothetical protein
LSKQKAPDGARHDPPVQAVFIGQSLGPEQLSQTPPPQKWSMQPAGVQGSDADWMQYLRLSQNRLPQSALAAQGAPPASPQTPALQWVLTQSAPVAHAAQTLPAQRPLPQATSEPQGSPMASLQKPASQTPLKQSPATVHGARKAPAAPPSGTPVQAPPTVQIPADSHTMG